MTPVAGVPDGFTVVRSSGATLIAAANLVEPLTALGLGAPEGWERLLGGGPAGPGRGAVGVVDVGDGALVLKRMRRGGLLAPLWRDRYPGTQRLLANLTVPLEVLRRGVPTAEPAALLLVPGPPGFTRGWLATRRLDGAVDLARRFAAGPDAGPGLPELRIAMGVVRRMHEAGVDHPDLNLGNVLLREAGPQPQAFVIDLDRAGLYPAPLGFPARQRAVRRLERSFEKSFGGDRPPPDWYALYADGSEELERAFLRGKPMGRVLKRLHRLGWRS